MPNKYDDLSKPELIRLLEARDRRDATRFGLVWEANEIERDRALNSDFVALDLVPEHSCGSAPYENLIIEGDNFDALRALRLSHAGQVKCIYIDPPYNTGNRDFVYNDSFVDREDSWRHSKWCEFMFQRLTLAKDLLREDGVIFVSIDDNEMAALRLLMDRVFGAGNFVANCIWQKRYSAANDHKTIAPLHDYILAYQAFGSWQRNLLPRGEEKDRQYRFNDEKGTFRCSDYTCNKSAEERPNLYYAIQQPNTGEEIWPKKTRVWSYSQQEHQNNVANDLIYWGKEGLAKVPSFKRYKHLLKNADGVVPTTWWPHEEVGHNDSAKKELQSLLPEAARSFSTPKPSSLISRILTIAANKNDIILDFFAGSGTTAHAVLKMNAEDGGKRRFILVSSTEATTEEPEKNLCRDVCATRVRRVIEGYGDQPGTGSNFAYLRTRRIPPGRLVEIEHAEVWTALQLLHCKVVSPFEGDGAQVAGDAEETLVYVPRFSRKHLSALETMIAEARSVIVYSWQPELLRQHLPGGHIQHEGMPEAFARRFGLKGVA